MKTLAVSEVFYSIQGEGKTTGIPSVFVRLAGCNLMCGGMGTQFDGELHNGAEWRCDSIEVWMKGKSKKPEEILDKECINAIKHGAHVILTGGEPMMQQKGLESFCEYIREEIDPFVFFEIETNGTIMPSDYFLNDNHFLFNCSPKLATSGNNLEATYKPEVLKAMQNAEADNIYKFVVSNEKDWEEIKKYYIDMAELDGSKIWLMPAGENQELLNKNKEFVVELAKKNYYQFCSRLHIDVWNKKTGV
jgi:7-carboxy-7-deazaguanine synthase